jgi:hypothetical protein
MKRLTKTPAIAAQLKAAYGSDANTDSLVVFEMTLANGKPLRKAGGIFEGAVLTPGFLQELIAAVQSESVPLQTGHQTVPLPVGRVFAAMNANGEARGLIAVNETTQGPIVADLDNGTIDQCSVGVLPKHLNCSVCGWDFADPKHYESMWSLTCGNDHVIGQNGVHAQLNGLKAFFETSLVGQGAVRGARVLGPSDSVFQTNPQLAASVAEGAGLALLLTATVAPSEDTMNEAQLASFTAALEGKATATVQLTAATAQITDLTAQLTASQTALAASQAELAAATPARDEAVAALAAQTDIATKALTALKDEATKILTACGKPDLVTALATQDVDAVLAVIAEHRAQFAAMIPAGGAAAAADTKPTATARPATSAAFQSAPNRR